ncbi:MAG: hypothetical protein ACFFG0_53210 [Candidatus Thorarchaeota archaeon]
MAQAIKSKDVRKNCVDVESVIMECLSEPEREVIIKKPEPIQTKKLSKELSKFVSEYNVYYHQELLLLDRVKQNLVYRDYGVH